jgi:hypothetical protein
MGVYTTLVTGLSVTPAASVPYNAKNLIIETTVRKDAWGEPTQLNIVAAPNASLLDSGNVGGPTSNEYGLASCWAQGSFDHQANTAQTFIPLSADNAQKLVFGLRMSPNHMVEAKIRIVGYTL